MTRVAIRKSDGNGNGKHAEGAEGSRWAHPFQALRDILHWDALARALPGHAGAPESGFVPDCDVRETSDAFVFQLDVPGVQMKDLDVRIAHNRLTVRGARAAEVTDKGETLYACERFFGGFSRSFTLPDGVDTDRVDAVLEAGVLTLTIPKKPEARARRVPIK